MSKSVCWILKIDENLFWLQFTICELFVRAVFVFFSQPNKYSCASHMLLLSADHDLHSRCSHILRPNWAKWLRASVSLLLLLVSFAIRRCLCVLAVNFGLSLRIFRWNISVTSHVAPTVSTSLHFIDNREAMKWYYYILSFNQNQLFLNWNSLILFEMQKNPHIKNENVNFSPDFEQPFVNEWHDISIIFKMFHKLIYMLLECRIRIPFINDEQSQVWVGKHKYSLLFWTHVFFSSAIKLIIFQ